MGQWSSFNYKEISKRLKRLGCYFVQRSTGTHELRYSPFTDDNFTVVNHQGKNIIEPTLLCMLKRAGITKDQFLNANS